MSPKSEHFDPGCKTTEQYPFPPTFSPQKREDRHIVLNDRATPSANSTPCTVPAAVLCENHRTAPSPAADHLAIYAEPYPNAKSIESTTPTSTKTPHCPSQLAVVTSSAWPRSSQLEVEIIRHGQRRGEGGPIHVPAVDGVDRHSPTRSTDDVKDCVSVERYAGHCPNPWRQATPVEAPYPVITCNSVQFGSADYSLHTHKKTLSRPVC